MCAWQLFRHDAEYEHSSAIGVVAASGLQDSAPCPPSGHVRHYGRQDGYLSWSAAPRRDRQSPPAAAAAAVGPSAIGRIGSDQCPWTILVEQGQRINLSVVIVVPPPDGAGSCDATAAEIIAEQPSAATSTGSHVVLRANVCTLVGNQSKRQLLISTGNVLQVYVSSPDDGARLTVLLHYSGKPRHYNR